MNDEKLIELVRQCPVLYDPSHAKYMDTSYKVGVWRNIGKELKEDISTCKTRWNNIRDNYRKSLKKNAARSLQNAKRHKLYRYSDQLDFLKIHFEDIDSKTRPESQEEEEDLESDHCFQEEEPLRKEKIEENSMFFKDEDLTSQFSIPSDKQTFVDSSRRLTKNTSCQKRISHQGSRSPNLVEYVVRPNETQNSHAVDTFLLGIGATLKTLSPYDLNLAKSEIFSIVQKYELNMLIDQQQFPSSDNNIASTSGIYIGNISSVSSKNVEEQ